MLKLRAKQDNIIESAYYLEPLQQLKIPLRGNPDGITGMYLEFIRCTLLCLKVEMAQCTEQQLSGIGSLHRCRSFYEQAIVYFELDTASQRSGTKGLAQLIKSIGQPS